MTTFSDNLPDTKSTRDRSIFFQPSETSADPAGVLSIRTARNWSQYAVVAFPAPDGQGFHFVKIEGGTDKESDSYDVFCSASGQDLDTCECKGALYHDTACKHMTAARAIIANQWLDLRRS